MYTGVKKNKRLKVILDANWYISACISRKSRRTLYYNILKNPRLQAFYSTELMDEFEAVIQRPKFSKIISHKQVKRFEVIALRFLKNTKSASRPA